MAKAVIDFSPLRKRLQKYDDAFARKGSLTTQQVGRYGLTQIQIFMPRDTSDSVNSMGVMLASKGRNKTEVQIVQTSIPHPSRTWNGDWFNVPLWMFESPMAERWPWQNGNIKALRDVPNDLRETFNKEIRKDLAEQWRLSK